MQRHHVPPQPGRPNPEPDPPPDPDREGEEPVNEQDHEEHKPGRDAT